MMRRTWIALLALLLVPTTTAHASAEPLDVEAHVLADEGDDTYAIQDGFDITNVFVREVDFPDLGDGIAIRVYLYGGPTIIPLGTTQAVEVSATGPAGTATRSIESTDGMEWTGDALLEAAVEPSDEGIGMQGGVQIFLPLSEMGAAPGDAIQDFRVRTYAGGDLVDIAPGGRPLPGTDGALELPLESTVLVDSYTLEGPIGYTRSTLKMDGAAATLRVENAISVVGQHIVVSFDAPGWTIGFDEELAASVAPAEHPTFTFEAVPGPDAGVATILIHSDLGGLERLTLAPGASGGEPADGPDIIADTGVEPADHDDEDASLPVVVAFVAIGAALWAARRR